MKLTAKVYTDETQLPIYDAIKGLPRLLDHTQIRAQILGATGQNVAQAGATSEGNGHADTHVGNVMLYQAELRSLPNRCAQITEIPSECKSCFK